jgi:arginase
LLAAPIPASTATIVERRQRREGSSLAGVQRLTVVGAPTSAGAYAPGQEDGPAALRAHGLLDALFAGGGEVVDAGDTARSGSARWRRSRRAARRVYLDRNADLNTPATTIDGALDWMGVAHMLGVDGADPALAGLAGAPPMLTADRVAYLALDLELASTAERERIEALRPAVVGMAAACADPAGAAVAALAALGDVPAMAVHFDVDLLDFLDAPLAGNVDRTPGLPLDAAAEALAVLLD